MAPGFKLRRVKPAHLLGDEQHVEPHAVGVLPVPAGTASGLESKAIRLTPSGRRRRLLFACIMWLGEHGAR